MKHRPQDGNPGRRIIVSLAIMAVLGGLAFAGVVGYRKLNAIWLEQSVVNDVSSQVTIIPGRRIDADAIRGLFDLRNGANISLIDFNGKRAEVLKRYPVIKAINITREVPGGITITVIEREPFARIGIKNVRKETGLACDDEGIVFPCRRGVEMLPMIREDANHCSVAGERLKGNSGNALDILLMARDPEFANLTITEIDSSHPDMLNFILSNYSAVVFPAEFPNPEDRRTQLSNLARTIATDLQPDTKVWNATKFGVITANTKETH